MHYAYDAGGQRLYKRVDKAGTVENTYYLSNYFELRDELFVHNIYAGSKLIAVIARGSEDNPNAPPGGAGFLSRDENTIFTLMFTHTN